MRKRASFQCFYVFSYAVLPLFLLLALLSTGCTSNRRAVTVPERKPLDRGVASWYGKDFHGRRTASGERYDMNDLTAAHRTLPFGTLLEVRNARNGRSVVVRVNDRGPYSKSRVLDLSYGAAREIGLVRSGTAPVELYLASRGGAPPRFTVQVAAFSDAERAVALKQELIGMYPETTIYADGNWNRVRVGSFNDRDQAESLRRELAVIGLQSIVVTAQ